jgi:hypothetical protein
MTKFGHIIFGFVICASFSFISCNPEPEWNGTVRYEVTGTGSDVSISASGSDSSIILDSVTLPWSSGNFPAHADDDTTFICHIKATSKSSDSVMLTAQIYVNNVLVKEKSVSEAFCVVEISYYIDNAY